MLVKVAFGPVAFDEKYAASVLSQVTKRAPRMRAAELAQCARSGMPAHAHLRLLHASVF